MVDWLESPTTPRNEGILTPVDVARLILEYLRVLAWPAVIAGAVWAFKGPIASKIESLKEAATPLVTASFFDNRAREVEERAEDVARDAVLSGNSETEDPTLARPRVLVSPEAGLDAPQERGDLDLDDLQWLTLAYAEVAKTNRFDGARLVAQGDSDTAVVLAWRELGQVARAALEIEEMRPDSAAGLFEALKRLRFGSDFVATAQELNQLHYLIYRGKDSVSPRGAADFIDACDHLARALSSSALASLRHPSRSKILAAWLGTLSASGAGG